MDMESIMGDLSNMQMPENPEELISMVTGMISGLGPAMVVMVVAILALAATWSWRLFKLFLPLEGAIIFAYVGNMIAPFAVEALGGEYLGPFSVTAVIVMLCAVLGAVLMGTLYKLAIVLVGAAGGWMLGNVVSGFISVSQPDLELFRFAEEGMPLGYIIVSAICAVILGVLAVFIFKALYIVLTSVGSMISAGAMIGSVIVNPMDENSAILLSVFTVLGVVAGVFCTVHQFKTAND